MNINNKWMAARITDFSHAIESQLIDSGKFTNNSFNGYFPNRPCRVEK